MFSLLGTIILGSLAAGFLGQAMGWYQAGQGAGLIASAVGAVVLLFIVDKVRNESKGDGGSTST